MERSLPIGTSDEKEGERAISDREGDGQIKESAEQRPLFRGNEECLKAIVYGFVKLS